MFNLTAIAAKFNVLQIAITRVEEWANCVFVVIAGVGARFVSKKVGLQFDGLAYEMKIAKIQQKLNNLSNITYQEADEIYNTLYNLSAEATEQLKAVGACPNGKPTPDSVRQSESYKNAKRFSENALNNLRVFSKWFSKQFKKEIKANRRYA